MKLKNVDNTLENLDKAVLNSLSFLDNKNIYISVVFILFLYNTCLFSNINNLVSDYYQNSIVKVVVLLLIIYVSRKSCLIGLLLGISFIISLNYKSIMENFESTMFPLPNSNEPSEAPFDSNKVSKETNEENMNENFEAPIQQGDNDNLNLNQNTPEENESFQNNDENQNLLSSKKCNDNYSPLFEQVSDVCKPVSTYDNELNTQGLNNILGYEKLNGSTL